MTGFREFADELTKPAEQRKEGILSQYGVFDHDKNQWVFSLKSDIDLNPEIVFNGDGTFTGGVANIWNPIGYYIDGGDKEYKFEDIFEANDHTISGLYIKHIYNEKQGLFSFIGSRGIVRGLHMTNGYINSPGHVGAICSINIGEIESCSNAVSICGKTGGGLVGDNRGKILSCSNSGYISGPLDGSNGYIGGISGANSGIISGCANSGELYAIAYGVAGGICSQGTGTVIDCENKSAKIDALFSSGISGGSSEVINCINYGNIVSKGSVGGIRRFR